MQYDIFLVSASYVSNKKFRSLADRLTAASARPSKTVRLEHEGESLFDALEAAISNGATEILLRPVGVPFSESLKNWVPNAAADWLARQPHGSVTLSFAKDLDDDDELIRTIVRQTPVYEPIEPKIDGLNGKGWDEPPAFEHHLLVCTGPRCHMRGSFGLLAPLKSAVSQAGLSSKVLIASTGCLYPCNNGPVLIHYPKGDWYQLNSNEDIREFVDQVLIAGQTSNLRLPFSPYQTKASASKSNKEHQEV